MKKLFLMLFLGFFSSAFAWGLKTGTYDVVGSQADGPGTYYGQMVIAPQGDNYRVVWRIGGNQEQVGVGIYRSWEGVLSVAFADLSRGYWGTATYKVGVFGDIEGYWTTANGLTQGTENLTWRSYSTYY